MAKKKENSEVNSQDEIKTIENPFQGFKTFDGKLVSNEQKELLDEIKEEKIVEDIDVQEEAELIKAETEHFEKLKDSKKTSDKEVTTETEVEDTTKDTVTEEDGFSYKPLVEFLAQKEIVNFDDKDFEDSDEGLEKIIGSTIESRVNDSIKAYKESLPEDLHKLVEFVELGGDPKQFMDLYYSNQSFENISIDDESNQKLVIKQGLKLAGLEDAEIDSELAEYEDLGKLEAKAKLYLPKIQKAERQQKEYLVEAQKQYAEEQESVRVKYWTDLKEDLFTKEDIKGFKLTNKLKDQIWDHMTKPVDKKTGKTKLQINNETRKDAQFLYAYLDMLDFDISKLEKKVESKVTSALKAKLGNFTDSRTKIKGGKTEVQEAEENPFAGFRKTIK